MTKTGIEPIDQELSRTLEAFERMDALIRKAMSECQEESSENLREATVEILRRLRKADEEAASVGPESQARFERKVAHGSHTLRRTTDATREPEGIKEQNIQAIEVEYRQAGELSEPTERSMNLSKKKPPNSSGRPKAKSSIA